LRRALDKHIDNHELNALVPSSAETGHEPPRLSPDAILEAEFHLGLCAECSRKVSKYRQLVNRFSSMVASEAAPPGAGCPDDDDVDWHEVAGGLWPELKAKQLIMHAALCDHCGPMLRAATSLDNDPTPNEEKLLAELKLPTRPDLISSPVSPPKPSWWFMRWLIPAVALMVIIGVLSTIKLSSPAPLSGPKYAEFAVRTHKQHAQGRLALDVHSDSQQALNEWLKAKSSFPLALPASPAVPGEQRPYRLEGARMVEVGGKTAAFIAYQVPTAQKQTDAVSLMVAPDSVAQASGGVIVDFKKVSFHYAMVDGHKVVTWSLHGLTYALVSQEGNNTQRSCMVCHSAMRDRDLSQTPTPLGQQPSGTLLN
jgi:anti-sigma factor RsiW